MTGNSMTDAGMTTGEPTAVGAAPGRRSGGRGPAESRLRGSRVGRLGFVGPAIAGIGLVAASSSNAAQACRTLEGRYREHAVGQPCTSPVGLCIAGEYSGDIRGPFEGRATDITPTGQAPTDVLLFTSDSTITAKVGSDQGTLVIKNRGVYQPAGTGSIVDLQTIVGGTGAFASATGDIRAEGTFVNGQGESTYKATLCLA
jgi:hypothetical protein